MLSIVEIMRGLVSQSKKIEISKLPTQGLFYLPDFEMKIRKADMEDIIDYEYNYDKENLYAVIESVKKIVKNNTVFNTEYKFEDLKSVDIFSFDKNLNEFSKRLILASNLWSPSSIIISNKTLPIF
jgi:hypothetical protein